MLNNPIEIDGIKCRRREKEVLKSANVAHLNINNHSPISSSDWPQYHCPDLHWILATTAAEARAWASKAMSNFMA